MINPHVFHHQHDALQWGSQYLRVWVLRHVVGVNRSGV